MQSTIFQNNSKYITILLSLLTQIINLSSSFLLKKLTKFEKYSTKSKEIFSDIRKYFLKLFKEFDFSCLRFSYYDKSEVLFKDVFMKIKQKKSPTVDL